MSSAMLSFLVVLCSTTLFSTVTPLSLKMSSTKPFALNAKFSIQPERRSEFLAAIQNDQTQTMGTEPAALQFVLGEDVTEENTFYLHEQYLGEEGFQAHCETPHFAQWKAFTETDPFVAGQSPVIDFFQGTHEPQKRTNNGGIYYCLNVELCIDPDRRDEFFKVIENNAKGSNNDEPLCKQYDWGESTSTPNTFYFHEQYEGNDGGKEGFDAHAAAPHFQIWETFAGTNPFTKPPVVSFYRTLRCE